MAGRNKDYVYGNTARTVNFPYEERKGNNERQIRPLNNKRKTVQWTVPYVIMLSGIVFLMGVIAIMYIGIQSDVTNLRNRKGALESTYEDLRISNELYYESILSNINLQEIERIAVEELGMQMAGEGQVMTYSGDIEDYVKQYTDIPD